MIDAKAHTIDVSIFMSITPDLFLPNFSRGITSIQMLCFHIRPKEKNDCGCKNTKNNCNRQKILAFFKV